MGLRIAYQLNSTVMFFMAAKKEDIAASLRLERLSDEEYRRFVYARAIPKNATNVHELSEDWVIPDIDRAYRDAWVTDGKTVSVDMAKAREVHKDKLRDLRAPLLAAADVEMLKAYKDRALQDTIEAKRQQLRDVTTDPMIAAARTPNELRAAIPSVLVPDAVPLQGVKLKGT